MLGQGITPREHHPAVEWVKTDDMLALVSHVEKVLESNVRLMPPHEAFIQRCCAAPSAQPQFQVGAIHKF
jgi:tryptophan halogenase